MHTHVCTYAHVHICMCAHTHEHLDAGAHTIYVYLHDTFIHSYTHTSICTHATNMTCTHTDLTVRESRDVGVEYGAGQTWPLEVLILGRESKRASWRRWPELSLERRVEPSGEGSWGQSGC